VKTDITWISIGLFVAFFPENPEAEGVIGQMIYQHGDNKCETRFAPSIIKQLKDAGWIVRKGRERKFVKIENLYMRLKKEGIAQMHRIGKNKNV